VRAPSPTTALKVVAGLGLSLAAFWATLRLIDSHNDLPPDRNVIAIVEATYGANCAGFAVPAGQQNRVKAGNATQKVNEICEAARDNCDFYVDVTELGDPAPAAARSSWSAGVAAPPEETTACALPRKPAASRSFRSSAREHPLPACDVKTGRGSGSSLPAGHDSCL
jgi:hypothetical protein